jgi:putative nucleotidyltransferase with HDIG domain
MSMYAITEAERTRAFKEQQGRPLDAMRRRGSLLVGGAYLLTALTLMLVYGIRGFSLPTAALYVVLFALAGNVRFDVGAGFTVPTQVAFVPMLFALPLALVPLLVPMALALAMVPQIKRGQISISWLPTALANSWFTIGPVLVLALAHDHSAVRHWQVLVAALAAQFACDFAASVVREHLYGGVGLREQLAEYRSVYPTDLALSTLGLSVAYSTIMLHSQLAVLLIVPIFGMLRHYSSERRQRLSQLAELGDAYQGTALLLGDVVEADDAYTGEHCKTVVRLALEVADELGLDTERKRAVEFGALLHDVGKIAVPKEIINKPGPLDEDEWAIMKTHTLVGQAMLEKIGGFMSEVGHIVRASHERWDGSGYPDGLAGEQIPLEARIVSACDAFNAMTTTRSYRRAMSFAAAGAELERCAGLQLDPRVVSATLAVVSRGQHDRVNVSQADAPDTTLARTLAAEPARVYAGQMQ